MARMIAGMLGKEGFAHSPAMADLEPLFAGERLTALPLNTRWAQFPCEATTGHRHLLAQGQ
jgi:hypothetical protein